MIKNEHKVYINLPQVLWGLVSCGTGLVWVQWVPSSPWDQEAQGGPTFLEGPRVLGLLTQCRQVRVNKTRDNTKMSNTEDMVILNNFNFKFNVATFDGG